MRGFEVFTLNTHGRDFAVGDIHGHFSQLERTLEGVGFDPVLDRVFSVGDMIDRGPESHRVLEFLNRPWFHAVRGNHEEMAIHAARGQYDARNYVTYGGGWFLNLEPHQREEIAMRLEALPVAVQVVTREGLVGIVHADCPVGNWRDLAPALVGPRAGEMQAMCQWGQNRIMSLDDSGVAGVRAVVTGHKPQPRPTALGNVIYIDTGMGVREDGYLTLLELGALEVAKGPRC